MITRRGYDRISYASCVQIRACACVQCRQLHKCQHVIEFEHSMQTMTLKIHAFQTMLLNQSLIFDFECCLHHVISVLMLL